MSFVCRQFRHGPKEKKRLIRKILFFRERQPTSAAKCNSGVECFESYRLVVMCRCGSVCVHPIYFRYQSTPFGRSGCTSQGRSHTSFFSFYFVLLPTPFLLRYLPLVLILSTTQKNFTDRKKKVSTKIK
ncbi:unnamed protein product [Pylaiella littoralis]